MGTLPKSGSVTVDTAATPQQVWDLLADVTRAGEWSHETQGGEWLDGAAGAAPGVRFRGRNKQGRTRWTRVCEILEADAPRTLSWRTIPSRLYADSTRWTYELEPTDTGCRITQRFEAPTGPSAVVCTEVGVTFRPRASNACAAASRSATKCET